MSKIVNYLHNELYMIHSNLHRANWYVRPNNDIVLLGFSCARTIGKNGSVPEGSVMYYNSVYTAPEHSFLSSFSFASDIYMLSFAF